MTAPRIATNAGIAPAGDSVEDRSVVTARQALTAGDRAEMLGLLSAHFDGVTPAQFARDLDEKDWVLRIRRDGRLVGFTTVQLWQAVVDGEVVHVLYSGDTIMSPEAWGSPILSRAWIGMVRELQRQAPASRWYWLLLTSGYRTYRFLPVFWREFWPRHDAATPAAVQRVVDQLAEARFGSRYDRHAGVVRLTAPQRLRGALAAVDDGRRADAHVAYFLAANPGHADGDELVCLTELSDANLTAAGVRMLRRPAP
ncbi:MAG: hypothetical protein IT355_20545 [Gemmatimonadaceae bacterium]|nr:hypothetical protein [Gemmatimonadaceae bacterium]